MINDLIKKLRKAADSLEELLDISPATNHKAAKAIRKNVIEGTWKPANKAQENSRLAHMEKVFTVGFNNEVKKRAKKHWTQTPAGKLKMAEAQRKSWAKRRAAK